MTDEDLMLAVRAGNLSPLAPLFERHHRQLFDYLTRMTGNRSAAEDLVVGRYTAAPPSPSSEIHVMRQELQDLRHMVTLSLMQQQSATNRLKGVSWSGQIDAPRNDIVHALLNALANEPNVNVRLASRRARTLRRSGAGPARRG